MYVIINIEDFSHRNNDIITLLSQLSTTTQISKSDFLIFLINKPLNHNIYVCIDNELDKIVGIITIIIESKLIHNFGKVAHIEDLVVDKEERNKGIAQLLINKCIEYAKNENCYKIILNCNENLIKFYEKSNFYNAGYQMRMNL